MKIAIIGAGAVGCLLGARLGRAGHEISFIARGATLKALQQRGVGLQDDSGLQFQPVTAVQNPAELLPQDLIILAVKGPSLLAIVDLVQPLLTPHNRVLVAMNGVPWWFFNGLGGELSDNILQSLDPQGELAAKIPAAQVMGCVVHLACSSPEPGVSLNRFGNDLIIGQPDGQSSPETQAVYAALGAADFKVNLSPRIQQDIWYKLWGNMTMNPVSALTRATTDQILADPLVREFCSQAMNEAAAIGERIGCPIEQSAEDRHAVTLKLGAMKTSMLQDVERGRELEVEAIIGAVHEIALKTGVNAPAIAALYGLVRLLGRSL
ncbi:MAG: 2-dehydropantoate 2-reductase [Thiolinea sp.]